MTSSPTPAVLPDTRARDLAEANSWLCARWHQDHPNQQHIMQLADYAAHLRVTPPASDAAVPAGFVLVPVELTDEQRDAAIAVDIDSVTEYPFRLSADEARAVYRAMIAAAPKVASDTGPIPMILHCPRCHVQHIDEPDERTPEWDNPPHRSHLCHACGCIWRPADVPTEGVASITTVGKADTPKVASEGGAGLREAAEVLLRGYRAMQLASGMSEEEVDSLPAVAAMVAALATDATDGAKVSSEAPTAPSDPSDGATGGGEHGLGRHALPIEDDPDGYDPVWYLKADDAVYLQQGKAQIFLSQKQAAILALNAATTPGGDLLEQAAMVVETIDLYDGDRLKNSDPRVTIAAAIRALSARNQTDEGGEK